MKTIQEPGQFNGVTQRCVFLPIYPVWPVSRTHPNQFNCHMSAHATSGKPEMVDVLSNVLLFGWGRERKTDELNQSIQRPI